ncbi:MAG: altronate dehydratase [Phycisphaera sp.]|nr:altronate dehydratase [Phycisphaera sp.]
MSRSVLLVHPDDDMLVALVDHAAGQTVACNGRTVTLRADVRAKHKVALRDFAPGASLRMYGITVGRATQPIAAGDPITIANLKHHTDAAALRGTRPLWTAPDVSRWAGRTFDGYARGDGRVGTANHWLVVPLVFCENRNLDVIRDALLEELGYARDRSYQAQTRRLIDMYRDGAKPQQLIDTTFTPGPTHTAKRVFPNVDGIKFLTHSGGCGGTYEDALNLCGLLAGYINHPNVAGATVLSLGCQKSQVQDLLDAVHTRNPDFDKPLLVFEQQKSPSEQALLETAIKHTFAGLIEADRYTRQPAALSHLSVGVECGGSDGFSGLSANPAIGHCSDLIVALDGSVILSEFPELAGCEQEIVDRCVDDDVARRFLDIMADYDARARAVNVAFETNPSPGNITDGLITDAIKSAGAAKKGGTSPVADAIDYPGVVTRKGLNLLCTPGGDVESTTAMAAAGANVMLFSTGLGTPTGNAVTPVLKVSTSTDLANRLPDLIDINAGPIITGDATIEQIGESMLDYVINTASGQYVTKAQRLGQDDFIPWKRGVSL